MRAENQVMNMNSLVKALGRRGFLVRNLENRLVLQGGSGRTDAFHLKEVLNETQIGFTVKEGIFILEPFTMTDEMIDRITLYKTYNQESWCPAALQSWKAFVKRRHGFKLDTLTLEPGVAYLIKQLSNSGILTMMSCDGHGRSEPLIWFSGKFSAAWYEIITNRLMNLEGLNYKWIVKEDTRRTRILTATKSRFEKWDIRRVQEDAVKLGNWFAEHAEELRECKRTVFKYRSMKKQATLLSEQYDDLKRWMEQAYKDYTEMVTH